MANTTPASEWGKKSAQIVTLPSGNVSELKQPDIVSLLFEDSDIPDFIAAPLLQNLGVSESQSSKNKQQSMTKQDLATLMRWASNLTVSVMVSPVCLPKGEKPDYEKNQISIDDVGFEDRMSIFEWVLEASGITDAAANFREQPNGSLPVAQDGD